MKTYEIIVRFSGLPARAKYRVEQKSEEEAKSMLKQALTRMSQKDFEIESVKEVGRVGKGD